MADFEGYVGLRKTLGCFESCAGGAWVGVILQEAVLWESLVLIACRPRSQEALRA